MKFSYTNFKKEFPFAARSKTFFGKWFYFKRYWNWKLITIGIKHHQITIDMRGDLFEEMTGNKRQS